ncbi:alcohol dehydrogenase [Enterococcus faecium]|jgi:lactaldehyde reductase|nr:lactaldehyde reductase [Enterococcus faecium TX0133a01]EFR72680.1 lactaldehyde reductase [Enterococcus faecium TX0133B]EFR76698.1 lactaldehyde reductase [Enterococcus faecium TX0133C]EJX44560.1 lactaldehyde reductase [Enterococcus faecium S447]EJX54187.1 lactaldehyde reductase [Enterococcus faecium R496]EJX64636.1 lactaldehyde reductase [Enterococcus faecium R446]EJX93020.1 lactaldehyde reductase [Enterococcus faecium ERV168]EJY17974.1 lactaldehyde reductase [Enterococcus faecium C621]EJ
MILNETSYFGKGAIESIVPEFQQRGFGKAAVITDKGLIEHGIATKVTELLDKAAIAYALYDGIVPNPTIQNVKDGVAFVKEAEADCLIAIGGGSPIDTAKAIGIILTNPEFSDVISLEGVADTKNPCLPILAIPTTSGTAAEVTINYVITDEVNHRKFVCVDPHDIPIVAFIDSDMMMGMPKKLAASTGMDAMTHAIEGFITKGAWEMTDMLHLKAIEIIGHSLEASVDGDQNGREKMALGQYIAGMGFSNVGLGLVHGMAHPLSAWYNIPHGVACAALLPTVMKYNKEYTGEKYREIALVLGIKGAAEMSLEDVREAACGEIDRLSKAVGIPETISELGVKEADIPAIAEDALRDVCTPGNPRETTVEEIIALYQSLM